jgi:hypothetical protein
MTANNFDSPDDTSYLYADVYYQNQIVALVGSVPNGRCFNWTGSVNNNAESGVVP